MTPLIIMKQHDTLPVWRLILEEPDPTVIPQTTPPTMRVVDLTDGSTGRICAKDENGSTAWTSPITFDAPRTDGAIIWTPDAFDTAAQGTFDGEIEITYAGGGIETYPNDGYFPILIFPDLCA